MGNSISYETKDCFLELPASSGTIKGIQSDEKSRRYASVPYARPPVGNLRWKKPVPLSLSEVCREAPDRIYDATKFGPVCPQADYSNSVSEHVPRHTYDEDCLRLNIWTPVKKDSSSQKWPVMIWFHGGWFQVGDPSQEEAMNPTELISTGKLDAIFVAVGYRLNVFGFLAGDALKEESGGVSVGNYGLWDQRLAIEWIYENIGSFGGDPDNITLAGRSAGAYSVQAQCLYDFRGEMAAKSRHHFRRLLMISNAIPTQPKTPEECQEQFDELCEYFQISSNLSGQSKLDILRTIRARELCAALMKLRHHTFRPVTDELFISSGIFDYHRSGAFAAEFKKRDLRLFIGEVLNEDTLYAATNPPEPNFESLELAISNYYSKHTTGILLRHYNTPSVNDRSAWKGLFGQIVADCQVKAPSRFLVQNMQQHGVRLDDVWRYMIAYRLSFITEQVAPKEFGVSHAMDRPLWNFSVMHDPLPRERSMMEEWIRHLTAFVHGNEHFDYGTKNWDEYKEITSAGQISIAKDSRWEELLGLMDMRLDVDCDGNCDFVQPSVRSVKRPIRIR